MNAAASIAIRPADPTPLKYSLRTYKYAKYNEITTDTISIAYLSSYHIAIKMNACGGEHCDPPGRL